MSDVTASLLGHDPQAGSRNVTDRVSEHGGAKHIRNGGRCEVCSRSLGRDELVVRKTYTIRVDWGTYEEWRSGCAECAGSEDWAALVFDVRLEPMTYVFLMVFFGFLVVVSAQLNFIGGFLAGAVFALQALGVGTEEALAMTLTVQAGTILTLALFGTASLWRFGLSLRDLPRLGQRNGAHSKHADAFFADSS